MDKIEFDLRIDELVIACLRAGQGFDDIVEELEIQILRIQCEVDDLLEAAGV